MKVEHVSHIGIGVPNLKEAVRFFEEEIGLKAVGFETVEDQKATVAFIPCGDARLELLESTSPDGPIGKAVEKAGGKSVIHHVALEVDDVAGALAELKEKGVRLIDEKPRKGAGGAMIAFIHPKATGGILLELCHEEE